MSKLFDPDFFKFLFGFICILCFSLDALFVGE